MHLCVAVEKPANHPLVLRAMPLGLALEEVHATLGERDRYLYPLLPKHKLLGRGQKVTNHSQLAQGLVSVPDSPAHRYASPCASNRRQRCEWYPQESPRFTH